MPLTDNGLELLTPDQAHALLARSAVGRVGVTVAALPAIFPVNYALLGKDIVFLTGEGTKLQAAAEGAVVAFQVDQFDMVEGWGWSVLAIGIATEITDSDELAAARHLGLRPMAQGDRTHLVRIRPEFISGRRLNLAPDPNGSDAPSLPGPDRDGGAGHDVADHLHRTFLSRDACSQDNDIRGARPEPTDPLARDE